MGTKFPLETLIKIALHCSSSKSTNATQMRDGGHTFVAE